MAWQYQHGKPINRLRCPLDGLSEAWATPFFWLDSKVLGYGNVMYLAKTP